MSVCTVPECVEHYACQLRAKGLYVSTMAMPTRMSNRRHPYRPVKEPSWEKGVVGEHRSDGSFMPVLAPGTDRPMGVHEHQSQSHKVEEGIRALKSDPAVFSKVS